MREFDAGGRRELVTEVPREIDNDDVGVALHCLAHRSKRSVGAAVVDEDDFVSILPDGLAKHGNQAREQRRNVVLLVIHRYDDA